MRFALGGVLIGAAMACVVFAPPARAAEVYKWKDAAGTVHYADAPPEGVKYERMKVGGGTTTAAVDPPKAPPAAAVDGTAAATGEETTEQAVARYNKSREQNCKIARDNLKLIESSPDVQKDLDGDGKPEPMNPAQREEEIKRNQALVVSSCNS